jgi:hypothetical protein
MKARRIRCPGCGLDRPLTRAASARLRDHKHPAGHPCPGSGMFECQILNEHHGDAPKIARLVLVE